MPPYVLGGTISAQVTPVKSRTIVAYALAILLGVAFAIRGAYLLIVVLSVLDQREHYRLWMVVARLLASAAFAVVVPLCLLRFNKRRSICIRPILAVLDLALAMGFIGVLVGAGHGAATIGQFLLWGGVWNVLVTPAWIGVLLLCLSIAFGNGWVRVAIWGAGVASIAFSWLSFLRMSEARSATIDTSQPFGLALLLELAIIVIAIRSLSRTAEQKCKSCGYDLRGTIAAGIERCPECGQSVTMPQTSHQ